MVFLFAGNWCFQKVFIYNQLFILSVCGTPPVIDNGDIISDTTNVVSGTTVNYECKDNHFAHGVNAAKLSTQCLADRTYSLSSDDLATCAPIC